MVEAKWKYPVCFSCNIGIRSPGTCLSPPWVKWKIEDQRPLGGNELTVTSASTRNCLPQGERIVDKRFPLLRHKGITQLYNLPEVPTQRPIFYQFCMSSTFKIAYVWPTPSFLCEAISNGHKCQKLKNHQLLVHEDYLLQCPKFNDWWMRIVRIVMVATYNTWNNFSNENDFPKINFQSSSLIHFWIYCILHMKLGLHSMLQLIKSLDYTCNINDLESLSYIASK